MPKINNWSKKTPPELENTVIHWRNDEHPSQDVYIELGVDYFLVMVQDRQHRKRVVYRKKETLEKAKEEAREFMKDNPVVVFAPNQGNPSWRY